ncbi:MAG: guanylate kinase [Neisseriaceae bacterium]|nr:guanylate kinase [Neisseriaceae bacterium]
MQGSVFIIVAPSGTGKTSLVGELLKQNKNIQLSISHTTRTPRAGEQNGQHYHFIDAAQFEKKISAADFLEYANVYGHYYGTSKSTVHAILNKGSDVLLEIDWQGFELVKAQCPDAVSIFIAPPSLSELKRRLESRGTDSVEVIAKRMSQAQMELDKMGQYDYIVVNEDFSVASQQLLLLTQAANLRTVIQLETIRKQFLY